MIKQFLLVFVVMSISLTLLGIGLYLKNKRGSAVSCSNPDGSADHEDSENCISCSNFDTEKQSCSTKL